LDRAIIRNQATSLDGPGLAPIKGSSTDEANKTEGCDEFSSHFECRDEEMLYRIQQLSGQP
jgi:hypothetical protein